MALLKTLQKNMHSDSRYFFKNQFTHRCHYHFTLFQVQNFENNPFVFK